MRALGAVSLLFPMRRIHLPVTRQRLHPFRPCCQPRVVRLEREELQVEVLGDVLAGGAERQHDSGVGGEVGGREGGAGEVVVGGKARLEVGELGADLARALDERGRVAGARRIEEDRLGEGEADALEIGCDLGERLEDTRRLARAGAEERRAAADPVEIDHQRERLGEDEVAVAQERRAAARVEFSVLGRLMLALVEGEEVGLVLHPLHLGREQHPPRKGAAAHPKDLDRHRRPRFRDRRRVCAAPRRAAKPGGPPPAERWADAPAASRHSRTPPRNRCAISTLPQGEGWEFAKGAATNAKHSPGAARGIRRPLPKIAARFRPSRAQKWT